MSYVPESTMRRCDVPGCPAEYDATTGPEGQTAERHWLHHKTFDMCTDAYECDDPATICTHPVTDDLSGAPKALADAVLRVIQDDLLHTEVTATERADLAEGRLQQAEAAIERVRRLCNLTIASSCRVQAIDQARDTLTVLDQPKEMP
ncbi:hypothetical protein [Actinomadura rugatobispora]|uniref:Uncharacterized protein n=1 Tax=Actinomadura rugatobispora TaxID=1994 RepID=A0ABW0ZVH5_9ACTN|nr:hypothetical protein GCM10010200_036160 [Actinomadura rugatobispora]